MERWLCLNCEFIGPLETNGRCLKCGSDAVVSEYHHQPQRQLPRAEKQVAELERLYLLK